MTSEKNFKILYLSECPLEKINELPKDSYITKWLRQNYAVERTENALKSKNISSKDVIRCQCFIEYNSPNYQDSIHAESERKKHEDAFSAKSGYITYINQKRYICKIEIENNSGLFKILEKYFKNKDIVVDKGER